MNLVPPGCALELNCASCPEPDLRSYDTLQHKLIVFDEASPKMVLRQKIFQCPDAEVQLGSSNTNCHSYSVWVHGCLFVICSNRWTKDCDKLDDDDREWLHANSILLQVKEPMWVEDS